MTLHWNPGGQRQKGWEPEAGWEKSLSRREAEVATPKHGGREAVHDRLRLDVQVPKHFVRPPTANHSKAVAVNPGAEQSHRATRSSGTDGDVLQSVRWVGVEVQDRSDAGCNVGRRNLTKRRGGA